ncbi:MAG: hypothetical protein AAGA77_23210 [Bacteroidota bacterium]
MNSNQQPNTLGIIGLIMALIALIMSFIECIGAFAILPGIVGLVLGVISYLKSKDEGSYLGLSIAVVGVSLLACAISGYQSYKWGKSFSDATEGLKEYTSCDDVRSDYDQVKKEMAILTQAMEDNKPSFSKISEMTKLGIKLGHIRKFSEKLECDIVFEDFDPGGIIEEDSKEIDITENDIEEIEERDEAHAEDEGEEESIREEKGN